MDLLTSLRAGRESLMAQGSALATSADNISNANTVGFKGSRAEFADLLAGGSGSLYGGPIQTGNGVVIDRISLMMDQGAVEATGRPLDVAVTGQGFFVFQAGETTTDLIYSRAGNFRIGEDGTLLSADGFPVLGFGVGGTDLQSLNVGNVIQAAQPSTAVEVAGNINAGSDIVAAPGAGASYQEMQDAAEFKNSIRIYDSLGEAHNVTTFFYHTSALGWTVQAVVDAGETGGTAGTPVIAGTSELTFSPDGVQTSTGTFNFAANWSNGANASNIAFDLSRLAGFASPSYFSSVSVDGYTAGQVVGTEIGEDGSVLAVLDNQERVQLGTIALAKFMNEGGLERLGDNNFRETESSGAAEMGVPQDLGRGKLVSQSLEGSNTDLAAQFVEVIKFQRAYQAGSQVIQTSNDLLNTTIQIA